MHHSRLPATPGPAGCRADFAEKLFQQLISRTDVANVDHTPRSAAGSRVAPSKIAIRFLRSCSQADSIISPRILTVCAASMTGAIRLWLAQKYHFLK